ncbi:MAG: DNA cytosine methyltransferase [Chloroflexota bacterium]|nr:DNA cytosine methyltransferase [Chloroflexota bacterium]
MGNRRTADFRSLELFTGAGGLALGTHLAGFQHRLLLEWNADACNTLRANSTAERISGIDSWRIIQADARLVDFQSVGAVDLIAGGPPCQPFSIGGKHRGMDDARDMIPQFVRAVRELAPAAFVLENVRGLLRSSFRSYFSYVTLQLAHPTVARREDESWEDHLRRLEDVHTSGRDSDLNYRVVFRVLNAADFGVPQTRERVFIVGFRADTGIEWHFPDPTHSQAALVRDQRDTGAYWEQHGIAPHPSMSSTSGRRSPGTLAVPLLPLQPWRTVRDAIGDLPAPTAERDEVGGFTNHRLRPGARGYKGHTGSPLDWPAKTLKAGDHGVPGGENMIAFADGSVRYFTVREAARLQTFPDAWHFEGSWSEAMRQLGNAVPVTLAHTIASSVARSLDGQRAGISLQDQ